MRLIYYVRVDSGWLVWGCLGGWREEVVSGEYIEVIRGYVSVLEIWTWNINRFVWIVVLGVS